MNPFTDLACAQAPRKKKKEVCERFSGGVTYPYDLWCLIGDYVAPESVNKFAVLCKDAYAVVCSARFWGKLYQR